VIPLYWVDAFTELRFGGNPAAVCLLQGPADERWMQGLAGELGLSETAFVWPEGEARRLRWFTPATEIDLCGHATLAAAHILRHEGLAGDGDVLCFRTRSGDLMARVDGRSVELDLPADPPEPVPVPAAHGLGVAVSAAASGSLSLVLELADADTLRSIVPDRGAIAALHPRAVVVTAPGDHAGVDYVLRAFGPRVGIDEDPVTGSAQCTLGPLWTERLGGRPLEAVQESSRGGRLRVTVVGDRVRVAGAAATVFSGTVAPP
jgi:predicted PhzF superfamily epimerase YddE/YHI9